MEGKEIEHKGQKVLVGFSSRDSKGRPQVEEMMCRGALLQYNGRNYITLSDYVDELSLRYPILTEERFSRSDYDGMSGYISKAVDDEATVRFLLEAYHGTISHTMEKAIQGHMAAVEEQKEREKYF